MQTNVLNTMRIAQTGGVLSATPMRSAGLDPAQFVTRGPLAARAHKLLGLGAGGSAKLGQSQESLMHAFGGSASSWQQVGNPWIGARSLARQRETLPTQSSVAWLMEQGPESAR